MENAMRKRLQVLPHIRLNILVKKVSQMYFFFNAGSLGYLGEPMKIR